MDEELVTPGQHLHTCLNEFNDWWRYQRLQVHVPGINDYEPVSNKRMQPTPLTRRANRFRRQLGFEVDFFVVAARLMRRSLGALSGIYPSLPASSTFGD